MHSSEVTAVVFTMALMKDNFTMNWNTTEEPVVKKKVGLYIGMTAFTFITAVFIFVVNAMIVAAPFVHKPLRKKTFLFVASLAVADILTALVHTAVRPMVLVKDFPPAWFAPSRAYCQTIVFFLVFPQLASVCNLLLIAIDRYVAIRYPLKYKHALSRTVCIVLLSLAWTFAMGISALTYGWYKKRPNGKMDCQITDIAPLHYHLGVALPGYLITVVLYAMYMRIYFIIRESKKLGSSDNSFRANRSKNASSSDRKLIKMLFITLGVFTFCWAPMFAVMHLVVEDKLPLYVIYVPYIMAYANSGMNFFIYAARSNKYKTAFRLMCPCGTKQTTKATAETSQSRSGTSEGTTKGTSNASSSHL